jgi:hypothetical protein
MGPARVARKEEGPTKVQNLLTQTKENDCITLGEKKGVRIVLKTVRD